MNFLEQHIESLVFASENPITREEIKEVLEKLFQAEVPAEEIETCLQSLLVKYKEDRYAFEVIEISGGFHFLTKGAYFNTVGTYLKLNTTKRLSKAALETLAIIAYKQPMSKTELELIRGVNCDHTIQKLLEKELVMITGRSEGPGKPLLYGTSEKFMNYFGLKTMDDLPKPKDFQLPENAIGEAAPIEVSAGDLSQEG